MEMQDSRIIAAPRNAVFAGLVSPDTLKACVPGAEEVTGSAEEGFEAVVVQKVGPVKAKFKGAVTVEDVVPGTSMRLVGEGKGGAAGFAKGAATVTFADHADGCELSYSVEAKVGGKIAQLGSRIIDGFAKKMADQFFESFKDEMEGVAQT
ncbi:CoxG family protein [Roseovarius sp. SYSU LYC5161]|uniref:CoxG family protein n=1 Tax=Roseovarius halophilus (ex Wu et al. 2025) TaxID=3376060 RepID=UPI00399B02C2